MRRLLAIGMLLPVALSGQALDAARFRNPPADVRPTLRSPGSAAIPDSVVVVGSPERTLTPEQLRAEVGRHVARGVIGANGRIILDDYWSDPLNPLSAVLDDLITWIARVRELARGRSAARMALLSQTPDSAFGAIVAALERVQASFDIITEAAFERAADGPGEVLAGGKSYHAVIVPPVATLSPTVAHRLAVLSRGGGTVIAWRPLPAAIAWPDSGPRFHALDSLPQLRAALIRTPWSGVREPGPAALRLRALERGEDQVFLLYNDSDRRIPIAPTFRMIGQPELWDPDAGTMRLAPTRWSPRLAVTDVPIELEPFQFVAIVFRGQSRSPRGPIGVPPVERTVAQANAAWRLRFATADTLWHSGPLGSWTAIDSGYSGTAVYEGSIDVPAGFAPGDHYWLDLGQVRDVAEVEINGTAVGRRLWRPYRFDVTNAVQPGENRITVRVTNTSLNRKGKPLPSGLLGPVRLIGVRATR